MTVDALRNAIAIWRACLADLALVNAAGRLSQQEAATPARVRRDRRGAAVARPVRRRGRSHG